MVGGGPSLRETPVPEEVHPPLTLRADEIGRGTQYSNQRLLLKGMMH